MARLILFSWLCCTLLTGCKKDLLRWKSAARIETGSNRRINRLLFLNDSIGIAVGGERFTHSDILSTRNAGRTWRLQTFPEAGKGLYGLTLSPAGTLYAIGFDGKLLRSTDSGRTWTFSQLSYTPCRAIGFFTAAKGLVVGGISFKEGQRHAIDSSGHERGVETLKYQLDDVAVVNASTAFLAGYGVLLKTNDTGRSWQQLSPTSDHFSALDVHAGGQVVYACGTAGSVFRTEDGGASWQRLRNGDDPAKPRYRFHDILFTDAQHGYCVGEDGLVAHTDDGGEHWMEYDRFTDAHLRCIVRTPDGALLVAGDGGHLWRLEP